MKLHNHYCTFWQASLELINFIADEREKDGALRVGPVYKEVKDGVALYAQHMVSPKPFSYGHPWLTIPHYPEYPRG